MHVPHSLGQCSLNFVIVVVVFHFFLKNCKHKYTHRHTYRQQTTSFSGVNLQGWLNQIQTNGLNKMCFIVIKVLCQVHSPDPPQYHASISWTETWEKKVRKQRHWKNISLACYVDPSKSLERRTGMCSRTTGKYLLEIY